MRFYQNLWQTMNYFRKKGNKHVIGQNSLRTHHLHPFFDKIIGEVLGPPPPPPSCEGIFPHAPTPLQDWYTTCSTPSFWNWHWQCNVYFLNAILLKIQLSCTPDCNILHHFFQNCLGGGPRTPTNGRGHPCPTLPTRPFGLREPPTPQGWVLHPPLRGVHCYYKNLFIWSGRFCFVLSFSNLQKMARGLCWHKRDISSSEL